MTRASELALRVRASLTSASWSRSDSKSASVRLLDAKSGSETSWLHFYHILLKRHGLAWRSRWRAGGIQLLICRDDRRDLGFGLLADPMTAGASAVSCEPIDAECGSVSSIVDDFRLLQFDPGKRCVRAGGRGRIDELMTADTDMITFVQQHRLANLEIIDVGTVAAAEIDHRIPIGVAAHEGMPAGRQLISFQHDVAGGGTTNGDITPVEDEFTHLNAGTILGSAVSGGQPVYNEPAPLRSRYGRLGSGDIASRLWGIDRLVC